LARKPAPRSPLIDFVATLLRIARARPEVQAETLQVALLASDIGRQADYRHGYRAPDRLSYRLRHPLWDDLTPEEQALLTHAAQAIERATGLAAQTIPSADGAADGAPSRNDLRNTIAKSMGDDLTPDQVERITAAVLAVLTTPSVQKH
jgi:hypothetical protein